MSGIWMQEPFAQRMREVYPEKGQAWLDALPEVLKELEERWRIRLEPPFADLSYHYVAPATTADGQPVVLKLGVPNPQLRSEADTLRLADGRGYVRLMESDEAIGALLLEQVLPGVPLTTIEDDDEATRIAAGVMRKIWQPAPDSHSFGGVGEWAKGTERLRHEFDGRTGLFDRTLVEEVEALFADLLPSMEEQVVLHGDLHHANILSAEREPWLAIDPKGIVGEAAYEVGQLLRNPFPLILDWPDPQATFRRRIEILADELGLDRRRMRDWAIAFGLVNAWDIYDDHGPSQWLFSWLQLIKEQSEVRF
ncbi:MAG TPA: aminoglycoside phosphotransferase family protein [Rubrobacter sp.]|nr:aminoglycoside phosphotransferase family protein [Rubrobacter sp.]